MKYCIGCKHWDFHSADAGYNYSTLTSSDGTPASMSCKKGHWKYLEIDENFAQSDFEHAMEKADNCPDYDDRHAEGKS
jgi:hypothetical protein